MTTALVNCPQCGGPHARPSHRTRFDCDFCGATIQVDDGPGYEELVCPTAPNAALVEETVRRRLFFRGIRDFEIACQPPRWTAVWQVTSKEGEEELRPANANTDALLRRIGLPALPLVERELFESEHLLPEAPLDASTAQDAARNWFEDPHEQPAHLRLIWFQVVELRVDRPRSTHTGLFVVGADRLMMPDLQRVHGVTGFQRGVVARWGIFALGSVATAFAVEGLLLRTGLLAALTTFALGLERVWAARRELR